MNLQKEFDRIDAVLTQKMAKIGIPALRVSVGIVFIWFGFLKFFPGVSSAEGLAVQTTHVLSFGMVPASVSLFLIAFLESLIGLGLIFGVFLRVTLFLLALQMVGTFSPLILFPELTFTVVPWVPTLEGQYIIKNLVLVSAGLVVGATVRGGRISPEPTPYIPGGATRHA